MNDAWNAIAPTTPAAIDPDLARQQLERILDDVQFRHSRRCRDLLRYIVEKSLAAQHQSLKERIIGIEVFERTSDYDTGADAIVRVAAAEVRKRLALYYKDPQRQQELRINIPSGSYRAEFCLPPAQLPVALPATLPAETEAPLPPLVPAPSGTRRHLAWRLSLFAAAAAVLALAFLRPAPRQASVDPFWAPLVGNAESINVFVNSRTESERQVEYRKKDLSAATSLVAFLGAQGRSSSIRSWQSTPLDSLKGKVIVVIGSISGSGANSSAGSWVPQLTSGLRFHFHGEPSARWIEDSTNLAQRNWNIELANLNAESTGYALITRARDASTAQWWIGIAGLTGPATMLAEQMITDTHALARLERQLPEDWASKNLQLVVAFDVAHGGTDKARVVASQLW